MSIATILSDLQAHSGLDALVSDRIYRASFPQGVTYPAILFTVRQDPENTIAGESAIKHYQVTFELYGPSYAALESIATQLKSALSASASYKSVCIAIADDEYQDDIKNFSIFLDFSIWF